MHYKIFSVFFTCFIHSCVIWNVIQTVTTDINDHGFANGFNIKERVIEMIENIRKDMKNNEGIFENVTLEPLSIKHQPFNINHSIGEFHGEINNVLLHHLSDFEIVDVNVNIVFMKFKLKFNFPTMEIKSADYILDGFIGSPPLFKIFGDGKFDLKMIDLKVNVDFQLGFQDPNFYFKNITLNVSLAKMEGYFHNLFGGGELEVEFNKVINELAPFALEHLWPEIKPIVEKKSMEVGNEVIKDFDLSNIIPQKNKTI